MSKRLLHRRQSLSLAEMFDQKRNSSISFSKTVEDLFKKGEVFISLDTVFIWCPGNGDQAIRDAVQLVLLTRPRELVIALSTRTNQETVEWVKSLQSSMSIFSYTSLRVIQGSRRERFRVLEECRPDHVVVYGSDETCRSVLNQVDPLTPRTVYGSKTSISIHYGRLSECDFRSYLDDAFSGGGVGCLNSPVLYANLSGLPLTTIEEEYSRYIQERGLLRKSSIQAFHLRASLSEAPFQSILSEGKLLIRGEKFSTLRLPLTGVGGGTFVIVNSEDPEEAARSEWDPWSRYLSSCSTDRPSEDLFTLGVTRICSPGQSQSPTEKWKHDGGEVIPHTYLKVGQE